MFSKVARTSGKFGKSGILAELDEYIVRGYKARFAAYLALSLASI